MLDEDVQEEQQLDNKATVALQLLRRRSRLVGHTATVNVVACFADWGEIVSGSEDGVVRIWSLETNKCVRLFRVQGSVTGLSSCAAGVYAVAHERALSLFDLRESKAVVFQDGALWEIADVAGEEINCVAFRTEKSKKSNKAKPTRFLCVSSDSGGVVVYEVDKKMKLKKETPFCCIEDAHPNSVCSGCVFHPQFPNMLITAGLDCTVTLYDFYRGNRMCCVRPAEQSSSAQLVNPPFVYCLDVTIYGNQALLAVGLGSGVVVIFDISDKQPVQLATLIGHSSAVNQVRFAVSHTENKALGDQGLEEKVDTTGSLLLLWSSSNEGNLVCWGGFLDSSGQDTEDASQQKVRSNRQPVAFTAGEMVLYDQSFRYMRSFVRHQEKINWMDVSVVHNALLLADVSHALTRYDW